MAAPLPLEVVDSQTEEAAALTAAKAPEVPVAGGVDDGQTAEMGPMVGRPAFQEMMTAGEAAEPELESVACTL